MKFLLIISHDAHFRPTKDLVEDIFKWMDEMTGRGILIHGNPLRPAEEAITVRVRGGKIKAVKGPSTHAKEKISAYVLIDCLEMDDAVKIASAHPMARAATIEVRPVWEELAVIHG
ncbi:MAG TPA: YciI family protein [Desulfomonilia bacterium]